MAKLCGKGVWLAHSYDLQRGGEMATRIAANYLLVKVGHGPYYFPETTRSMIKRVHTLGFRPLAWLQVTDCEPQESVKAIVEALSLGYESLVISLGNAFVTARQIQPLADALVNAEIPSQRLYLATPPLVHMPDRRVLEVLAPLCQGGWMPLCFATWGSSPAQIIDRDVYQALGDLSLFWGKSPEVYPVISPLKNAQGELFLPEEFIPWVEGVMRHGVDFFSIYHAKNTEKVLWPLLESINTPCLETDERPTVVSEPSALGNASISQPVYITISTSDTVWAIITRHGLNKEQFWMWNAHLWESRGLPRDPDYLQEGWRVRVK